LLDKVEADARLTRYLLGAVSATERENIEAEYLVDEDVFEQMLIAEDELVDAYARGELSDQERGQFEKNFLTSERGRDRVHFSQALAGAVSDARPVAKGVEPSPSPSFFEALWAGLTGFRVAGVAFAVLLVAAFSWLLLERMSMRAELQGLRAERARLTEQSNQLQRVADAERARNAELAAQLAERGPEPEQAANLPPKGVVQRPSEDIIAFNISPGSVRGSGGTRLAVPRSAKFIRLTLSFERPSSHQEYRAAIETADGNTVWRNDSFGSRSGLDRVSLPSIPASALPPGDYVLLLSGKQADGNFAPVANYSFRISRK